mgnify:FL=1
MASISKFPARNCWRVDYIIHLKNRKVRRAKYPKSKAEARLLSNQLEHLEQATKNLSMARQVVTVRINRRGFLY